MTITWIDIISIGIAIISFVYGLIERSKRMPLWWTLKGLEKNSMSNMSLYQKLADKYNNDQRENIPKAEVVAQVENAFGIWSAQREVVIGIRNAVDSKTVKPKTGKE